MDFGAILHYGLKLTQEANIVFRKQTKVIDLVSKHGYSFDTHSERKTGKFFRVDAAVPEHIGMHHSGAGNFYPTGILADIAAFAFAD